MANQDLGLEIRKLESLPASTTCRRIDFDKAEVRPGFIPNTWFLFVSGQKPWATMIVSLQPLIYIDKPEYWGIEVVGCLSGIGLPQTAPYTVVLDITHVLGKKGVEVMGATRSQTISVP
jgi:hypothetical protein